MVGIAADIYGFNSSMVRFGAAVPDYLLIFVKQFQFQYGAIWRAFEVTKRG